MPMMERNSNHDKTNSLVFSLKNQVGGLARALQVFQVNSQCRIVKKDRANGFLFSHCLHYEGPNECLYPGHGC